MKRISISALFVAVVTLTLVGHAPVADAQAPSSPLRIYAGGGLAVPLDPPEFKDSAKTGYQGMLGLGINMGPGLELVGKVQYASFGFEAVPTVADGGKFKTFMYGLDARFSVGAPAVQVKPFVFAGLGYASVDRVDISPSGINPVTIVPDFFNQQDEIYYNFGGGFEFAGGPLFKLFIQAQYVSISTDPAAMKFVPVTVGIRLF